MESIELAQYKIPEVMIVFRERVIRGNRATKICSNQLFAFDSPNLSYLATFNIKIKVRHDIVLPIPEQKLVVRRKLSDKVGIIYVNPWMEEEHLKAALRGLKGAVFVTYGMGNFPSIFLDVVSEARDQGVVMVAVTQCGKGVAESEYAAGHHFVDAGVQLGLDMTAEAAAAKLVYLLGQTAEGLDEQGVKDHVLVNLRGEITSKARGPRPTHDAARVQDETRTEDAPVALTADSGFTGTHLGVAAVVSAAVAGGVMAFFGKS